MEVTIQEDPHILQDLDQDHALHILQDLDQDHALHIHHRLHLK
jgi:hypothetical protein